jgi:transposase
MKKKEKREPESIIKEIKRKARRKFTAEEKIRIVLEGLQGESSIADNFISLFIIR